MSVRPTDVLCVPHRKRISHAYVTNDDGIRELCIYYGSKEVSFSEERLFPFGEHLISQSSFTADSATTWGPGYEWPEVQSMLEALVAEGIVKSADGAADPRGTGLVASLVPPSQCPVPRMWSAAECESITRDLGGRPIEIGNLEVIVATHRIAHAALDGDGRQVGEANVFPHGLRLDRDTEWRACQYTGSRYRDDAPMNITALKAMIKYWKPMMAVLLAIRAEVLRRLPRSQGGWTIGDLHTFSRVVLAVPAYQLMKRGGSSPQPPLHPILSSMFRITDGIRMTTHDMLFLSAERTRHPEEPVDAAELYRFAENNGLFLSPTGVCAGPVAMMDEFFATVFDGTPLAGPLGDVVELPAEVQALLTELPAAVDYGLLGSQAWTIVFSLWLEMRRAYEVLRGVLALATGGSAARLRARLDGEWAEMERERIGDEHELEVHRRIYLDTYESTWPALRTPAGAPKLAERIVPCSEGPLHAVAAAQLRSLVGSSLTGLELGGSQIVEQIVRVLIDYIRAEQGILASAALQLEAINSLLDRQRPTRPLRARDFRVTFAMHPPPVSQFPYLFDALEDELGFRVDCSADTIEISDRASSRASAGLSTSRASSSAGA